MKFSKGILECSVVCRTLRVCVAFFTTLLAMGILPLPFARAATCESLAKLALAEASIKSAKSEPAGTFKMPKALALPGPSLDNLPAFCRVTVGAKPTEDSDIKFEVWMPTSGWNHKFLALGNGGWAGAIPYPFMGEALRRGYATASTDTGHEGDAGDARFALGHPEKVIDFGYRAVHEMTVKAKTIMAAYYREAPKLSYWNGCSLGGKQGLTEAQRFPRDYDGIIAGAPANFWTHLVASGIWIGKATRESSAGYLPKEKYAVLHTAVLEACDALDGVKDGVLENPRRCHFDPNVLLCKVADSSNCLTAAQQQGKSTVGPRTRGPANKSFPGLSLAANSAGGFSLEGRNLGL